MTEYKRYQGKSYMICKNEECRTGYEIHMLQENRIPGLLPLQIAVADGSMQCWYEISGKHDMEMWTEEHKMGRELLEKFFLMLQQILRHLGKYLLSEEGICLDPKKIFFDFEDKNIYFCYTPFEKKKFEESLRNFMEYYIQHMSHTNQEDIKKCYEVYDRCQGEHIIIEEILSLLMKEEEIAREETIEEITKETKMTEKNKEKESKRKPLISKTKWSRKKLFLKKRTIPKKQYIFEPQEQAEESSNPTVFLGSETDAVLGELRYEGNGNQGNFSIHSPIFLIGNQRDEADGIIHASTVSRIHARVTKEGEDYYIEDMNSTNGTCLNGEILNYKEKVQLKKNDLIQFAEETYRFV